MFEQCLFYFSFFCIFSFFGTLCQKQGEKVCIYSNFRQIWQVVNYVIMCLNVNI